jgi:acetate kinase
MKILVINAGSSSLKYQLFDMDKGEVLAKGLCERIGIDGAISHKRPDKPDYKAEASLPDHKAAIELVLSLLTDKTLGVIASVDEIGAVGHRFAHGGEKLRQSSVLGAEEIKYLESIVELNPLHGPPAIAGMRGCRKLMPSVPMVGVFDTSFHSTMPPKAYIYPIPYELYEEKSIRRYGFHGTSHRYVAQKAAEMMGEHMSDLRIITCHLGNGASLTAIKYGKSVDTSMGYTPLEGLIMGTRSGEIDPAIIPFLMEKENMDAQQIDNLLNRQSGILGISGVSSDFRDLEAAANDGDERSQLAIDIFAYKVRKYIGGYVAAMGGVDAIVFTAGLGENSPFMREKICNGLEYLGTRIDPELNKIRGKASEISIKRSRTKIFVVPTNEELVIARDTKRICGRLAEL